MLIFDTKLQLVRNLSGIIVYKQSFPYVTVGSGMCHLQATPSTTSGTMCSAICVSCLYRNWRGLFICGVYAQKSHSCLYHKMLLMSVAYSQNTLQVRTTLLIRMFEFNGIPYDKAYIRKAYFKNSIEI